MKQFIIRFGGLVPVFYAGEVMTCHPDEATKFNSIDEVLSSFKCPETTRGVSIVDAKTLEFVKWLNW